MRTRLSGFTASEQEPTWTVTSSSRLFNRSASLQTAEAEAMSRDLKTRGFRFVGPTICYAFMQAVGLVNDHTAECFRAQEV
jgi:DNA-3-methyladenine glycosylase I